MGLDQIIPLVYKNTIHQKCVVHLKRSILNKVSSKDKLEVAQDLKEVFNLENSNEIMEKAIDRLHVFSSKSRKTYRYIGNLDKN